MATLAHVTPEVLRWARESIGFEVEDAAARIRVPPEKLEGAESGDVLLTLRQAERAADVYDRPLAALFLPEPPEEEPQEAQFRRLPGAPAPPLCPGMWNEWASAARTLRRCALSAGSGPAVVRVAAPLWSHWRECRGPRREPPARW